MSNLKCQISRLRQGFGGQANVKRGFSLVELIVVMSIMATLIGLITINLASTQQRVSLSSLSQNLVSDIRQQQIKAMVGDSEGRASSDTYGVHIDSNQYVLFHGTYALEPSNFVVNLPDTIKFDTVSSRSEIIFEKVSGEIYQFSSGPDKVILQDTTNGNTKTIKINQYGVIKEIN